MSRAVRSLLAACAAALVVIGLAVAVLLMPWFTRLGIQASGAPALVESGRADALDLAETVRRYVAGREDELPRDADGRAGFDQAAVSHLADVRRLVAVARWVAIVALVALWNLVAHAVAHGTQAELARGLRWGGFALVGASSVFALVGAADFSSTFVVFHEVLFPHGGWLFPYDALLIRLFPERFWTLAGAAFLVLSMAGGVGLVGSARFLRSLLEDRVAPGAA